MNFREGQQPWASPANWKKRVKSVYGMVKSILSMDHQRSLLQWDGFDLFPTRGPDVVPIIGGFALTRNLSFSKFYIIEEGLMWNSILDILP